jgi:hypothetical protein
MITCEKCHFWQQRTVYHVSGRLKYEACGKDGPPEPTIIDEPYWTDWEPPNFELERGIKILETKPSNFGSCKCPRFMYGDHFEDVAYEDDSDALIYVDYEGWNAYYYTGKDFGCVHGEEKNSSP